MARHSPPPPAAADGSAASGAAAHDPAGSVQWNQDTVGARTLNQSYEQIPHPDGGGSNNGEMDGGRAAGRGTAAAAAATAATTAALPVASVVLAAAAAPTSAPRRPLEAIRVFTREYRRKFLGQGGGGGEPTEYSRHFVATTYRVVWRRFQSLQATHRHFYEVIRSDRPCHLYFDIEFSRSANPGVDGDALVDRLLERLLELMRSTWNVQLCPSSHVLELESVTEAQVAGAVAAARAAAAAASAATATAAAEAAPAAMCAPVAAPEAGSCHALPSENVDKFSRHLVVRLPGMALAHNGVAGAIVAKLRPFLQADGLFLLKAGEGPGGATACIVDPAVYSRERHFRMIWCSKGGKAAVLRPTGRYIMGPRETQHQNQQHAAPASAPGRGGPVAVAAAGTCGRRGASGAGEVAVMATAVVAPVPLEASPPTSQQLFLASLICNVHPGARLLDVPQGFLDGLPPLRGGVSTGIASNRSSYRHAGHAYEGNISHPVGGVYRSIKMTWAAEAEDLCDAAALQPPPPLQHQRGQQGQAQGQGQQQQSGGGGGVGGGGRGGGIRGESDCVGCGSHHQTVLQRLALGAVSFVELMATDRAAGAEALVRSIAYCGEGASVTYGMIGPGSHFCDRIGRRHRSNHVFFLLDFLRGCYCQKCYDPECAGWRSEWNAMPPETWQLPGGTPAVALLPQPQPQPQLQPDPGTTTSTSLAAAPHSAAIAPSGSHPCTKNAGNLPEGPSGGVRCSSRATATTTGGGCGDSKPTLVSELFAGLYQWAYGDDVME
ncbi:hypothetical protein Vretimale_7387 [Volvox reticuliferus]|uniref:DNA-directed primase/polymerase protein n=1 Tax=Volvox reticuliferus TaxID=1737510 RepID=A0A8J4G990_9CHLO|nr:hypothetical protein Vretimale_7387 [Volvox reticuliferus]